MILETDNFIRMIIITKFRGEKPGLVVRAEDSHPTGRGFKSCRILDGCKRFASYYNKEKMKLR